MFLTITIDTSEKRKELIKMRKKKISAKKGWRKAPNVRKTSIIQRFQSWRRTFRTGYYKFGRQIAMI